jgi:hypothetical protein
MDFLELKTTRDSIVNIKGHLGKTEWLEILDKFHVKATGLRGSESAKEKIEKDLKFLNDNLDNIPESEFGELYKHIIERWTGETYKSVMSNAAIDFIDGRQPPCNL